MFKKSPSNLGPSTALRSSDRRKLVNAVQEQYPILSADEAKKIVPDGIKSGKVVTSGDVQGVSISCCMLEECSPRADLEHMVDDLFE
jgi:dihydroxyacetone kinase